MGLRDRILDYIAKVFMPVPDHPARGGMTGTPAPDDDDETEEGGGTERTAEEGDETENTAAEGTADEAPDADRPAGGVGPDTTTDEPG